jgi:glyoxylase-like metal-dependent hydrolase (beta-lactamase superfamily II)
MATVKAIFDNATYTMTYVVFDEQSRDAIIIDPVLDYDPLASQTSVESADGLVAFVKEHELNVHWILETHAHADHLSSAQILKKRLEAGVAIGERITLVQETFKNVFDLPELATDGSQFDKLVKDGEVFSAGALKVEAIATPGHTPACMSFKVDDLLFVGDALFMPDFGTGRCDFPKGSADDLYASVHDKLYALPDATRVFVGHDYQPGGRQLKWETSIGESKRSNKQLKAETSQAEFVKFRQERDATLRAPRLIYQSVQVNVDAGKIPQAQANGIRYLRLPLNAFGPTDDLGVPS